MHAQECAKMLAMTEQSDFYNNAVFWVEVDRISPNPFQPRREFDIDRLNDLAESIRQYGILQPLVVSRQEIQSSNGGLSVEYELLAGERRLRASKIAGLAQVPVLIRAAEDTNKMKLEIAIIENLQREDLNPLDRAKAFKQLVDDFNMKHTEVAKKIGKSREYVSNTLRLLNLPENMQQALVSRQITEGHTRPLLMLIDRPQEQQTLFKEITIKKMTVREAERAARTIATDRARKQDLPPELASLERELTETLGTRVQIEKRENGGKVRIDFFNDDDIRNLLKIVQSGQLDTLAAQVSPAEQQVEIAAQEEDQNTAQVKVSPVYDPVELENNSEQETIPKVIEQQEEENDDLYSIKNFSI